MRRSIALLLGAVGLVAGGSVANRLVTAAPQGSSAAQVREAGATFRRACASCHFAPNTAFATDRAWLDQIKRTS